MAEPLLTRSRRAVWDAIDHWPGLDGAFRRRYRFEDVAALAVPIAPSIGDLPAIAIFPDDRTTSQWVASQTQRLIYTLQTKLWTPPGSLELGERLWEEITRALLRSSPEGQPTYLATATGDGSVDFGPLHVTRITVGKQGPAIMEWRWTLGLRLCWQPALTP